MFVKAVYIDGTVDFYELKTFSIRRDNTQSGVRSLVGKLFDGSNNNISIRIDKLKELYVNSKLILEERDVDQNGYISKRAIYYVE